MKKKKRVLKVFVIVLGVFILFFGLIFSSFISKAKEGERILGSTTFTSMDASKVSDGVYMWKHFAGRV